MVRRKGITPEYLRCMRIPRVQGLIRIFHGHKGIEGLPSSVVKYKIDTSELLQSLQCTTGEETLANGSFEAVKVSCLTHTHLILMVCADFGEL